ncbi:MAG TPA: cobalamin biosynthesis protein [Anaeromyxobacteraceae bacterium]|nr:cobalamin biosynthesis protein [Anaeromyxobacteraceae bacterium]
MTLPRPLAVHAVTRGGVALGARLAAALGADLHAARAHAAVAPEGAQLFDLPMAPAVARAFPAYRGHLFVMATGAVVRLVAPLLGSKRTDPAVVCVDEAGTFAVSLLSGHAGGANELARAAARAIGATPVVTTASDVLGTLQVDLLGRGLGWTMEDPRGAATRASAAVVNGAPVLLVQEAGEPGFWPEGTPWPANVTRRPALGPDADRFEAVLLVTDRLVGGLAEALAERLVLYRPRSLVLGVGCDRGAPPELVARGVAELLHRHGLSLGAVGAVATVDLKADEAALLALASSLGVPLRSYAAAALDAVPGTENPSARVLRLVGTRGVCEPAALLASGAARLVVPKTVYREPGERRAMTLAVARVERRAEEGTHG